jgi:hypothetical protein
MSISSTGLYGSSVLINSDLFNDVETLKEEMRIYVCMYVCITYVCMYALTHECMYVLRSRNVCVCACVCMDMCCLCGREYKVWFFLYCIYVFRHVCVCVCVCGIYRSEQCRNTGYVRYRKTSVVSTTSNKRSGIF